MEPRMILTISLPDEVYLKYEARCPESPATAITSQLEYFQNVGGAERGLLLSGEERRSVEKILGRKLDSGGDLVAGLSQKAAIKIGDFSYHLTPAEQKRLDASALKAVGYNSTEEQRQRWMQGQVQGAIKQAFGA